MVLGSIRLLSFFIVSTLVTFCFFLSVIVTLFLNKETLVILIIWSSI